MYTRENLEFPRTLETPQWGVPQVLSWQQKRDSLWCVGDVNDRYAYIELYLDMWWM
jgi:hypothetical protein